MAQSSDSDDSDRVTRKERKNFDDLVGLTTTKGKKSKSGTTGTPGTPTKQRNKTKDPTQDETNELDLDALRQKLESEKAARLAKLANHDPVDAASGVYVVGVSYGAISVATVAGYLNCLTVAEFVDFVTDPEMKRLFAEFMRSAKAGFGVDKETADATSSRNQVFSLRALFKKIENNDITLAEVQGTSEKTVENYPNTKDGHIKAMYLEILRFTYGAMKAFPERFPGAWKPEHSTPRYEIMESEDINRGVVLLRFLERKHSKSTDSNKDGGVTLHRKGNATLPIFNTPGFVVQSEQEKVKHQAAMADMREEYIEKQKTIISAFEDSVRSDDRGKKANIEAVVGKRGGAGSGAQSVLTDAQRMTMLSIYESSVVDLCPGRSTINPFFTPETALRDKTQEKLQREQDADDAFHDGFEEQLEAEALQVAKESFTRLSADLNKQSATPAVWAWVKSSLGLEVEDCKEPDSITKQPFVIRYRGLQLMPWQPQAVDFLVDMVQLLKTGILADDTGLGKTVTTLTTIVELSHRTKKAMKDWDATRQRIQETYTELVRIAALQPGEIRDAVLGPGAPPDQEVGAISMDVLANFTSYHTEIEELGPRPTYKPVLIVVPPTALTAWMNDSKLKFGDSHAVEHERNIRLRVFTSAKQKKSGGSKDSVIDETHLIRGDADALKTFMEDCCQPEAQITARTVILCTLQSWHRKVLRKDDATAETEEPQEPARKTDTFEEDSDEDEDEYDDDNDGEADTDYVDDETLKGDPNMEKRTLAFHGSEFSTVVIDEAHRVKNPSSWQTQALWGLKDVNYILCTATPFKNRVQDFAGLMRFAWKNVAAQARKYRDRVRKENGEDTTETKRSKAVLGRADYKAMNEEFRTTYKGRYAMIHAPEAPRFMNALDPANYISLLATNDVNAGADVVRLPVGMTTIRRVKGQIIRVHGHDIELGAEIPHYEVTTHVLRPGGIEASMYRATADEVVKETHTTRRPPMLEDSDGKPAFFTQGYRRLVHAAFNPLLDNFHRKEFPANAKAVHQYASGNASMDAFTLFHLGTKTGQHEYAPTTPVERLQYLAGCSVKMQKLCILLKDIVLDQGKKVIIYADLPLTLFCVEMLLDIVGINFVSIRAGISNTARAHAEYSYNYNPQVRVLVGSSRSAAESLNLQHGGHHMIICDVVPPNANIQIIGRANRIGQRNIVQVHILTVDETIDMALQSRYLAPFRIQVAAMSEVPEGAIARALAHLPAGEELKMEGVVASAGQQGRQDWMAQHLREAYADGMLRQLFGLRTDPTPPQGGLGDYSACCDDPYEIVFRLGMGGTIANEMYKRVRDAVKAKSVQEKAATEGRVVNPEDVKAVVKAPVERMSAFLWRLKPREHVEQLRRKKACKIIMDAVTEIKQKPAFQYSPITTHDILSQLMEHWPDNDGLLAKALKLIELDAPAPAEDEEDDDDGKDNNPVMNDPNTSVDLQQRASNPLKRQHTSSAGDNRANKRPEVAPRPEQPDTTMGGMGEEETGRTSDTPQGPVSGHGPKADPDVIMGGTNEPKHENGQMGSGTMPTGGAGMQMDGPTDDPPNPTLANPSPRSPSTSPLSSVPPDSDDDDEGDGQTPTDANSKTGTKGKRDWNQPPAAGSRKSSRLG